MKKIKLLGLVLSLMLLFSSVAVVSAEEVNEENGENEAVETLPEGEEGVEFNEMWETFKETWLEPLLSAIAGAIGSFLTVLFSKMVVNKLAKKVEDSVNSTEEEKTKVINEYEKAVDFLKDATASAKDQANVLLDTVKSVCSKNDELILENEKLLSKFDTQQKEVEEFKTLIGYLISTTPSLASNGYATKILDLLNEGSEKDEKEI